MLRKRHVGIHRQSAIPGQVTKKGKDEYPSPFPVDKNLSKARFDLTWFWFPRPSSPSARHPEVGRRGPSFHHPALALLELALLEQAAAAGEAELAPPSYRTLQKLASKRRGLLPRIKRFSFPS
jgi:hypothetical protein